MTAAVDILGVMFRTACWIVMAIILTELRWASKGKGEVLDRLREVWIGFLFLFSFPAVAAIDKFVDLSPGFDLYAILSHTVWIAYAALLVSLLRFWRAIHRAARGG